MGCVVDDVVAMDSVNDLIMDICDVVGKFVAVDGSGGVVVVLKVAETNRAYVANLFSWVMAHCCRCCRCCPLR